MKKQTESQKNLILDDFILCVKSFPKWFISRKFIFEVPEMRNSTSQNQSNIFGNYNQSKVVFY